MGIIINPFDYNHMKRYSILLLVLLLVVLLSGVAGKGRRKGHKHAKQVKELQSQNVTNINRKVLWFMAVQSTSKDREKSYYNYVIAAVNSAKTFAPSLAPVLIHGGSGTQLPPLLRNRPDLRLVSHNLTFLPQLTESWGCEYPLLGAWYRFDVPFIVRNLLTDLNPMEYDLDYVLYTDTDVLFFNDFTEHSLPKPPVLYIGPEHVPGIQANSGVLYMNVTAMQEHWPSVLDLAINRNFSFDPMEQGLFLEYYVMGNHSTLLPDRFNWKGYWGGSDDIVIAHFHGPKPGHCLSCLLLYRVNFLYYCAHTCLPDYLALMRLTSDGGAQYERMLYGFSNFTRHD